MTRIWIPSVQWGSKYRTSLVFKWSKIVWSLKDLVFECHLNTGLYLVWYTGLPYEIWTSEYRTSKSLLFRFFCYSDACYSDTHSNWICPIRNLAWSILENLFCLASSIQRTFHFSGTQWRKEPSGDNSIKLQIAACKFHPLSYSWVNHQKHFLQQIQ